MFERFTKDARRVVAGAVESAEALGHTQVASGHLLLALASTPGPAGTALAAAGATADRIRERVLATTQGAPLGTEDEEALKTLGIDLAAVRERVEESYGPGALDHPRRRRGGRLPFARDSKKSLELALREAVRIGDRYIGSEHLLLGILRAKGAGHDVLRSLDVDVAALRGRLETGEAA